jgi:hypothetical protein
MLYRARNILLASLAGISLYGGSIEVGSGKIDMLGGIFGYNETISMDTLTYSWVEHHKNIFSSNWYYRYNITWYDSDALVKQQNSFNSIVSNLPIVNNIQNVEYRMQGLDANFALGKDLYHENENRYIAFGMMIGISMPWVDSNSHSSGSSSNANKILDGLNNSKTTIYTYKIGPTISASYDLNKYFMIYGSATYAYQIGKIKNSYFNSSFKANGTFTSCDFGLKFQPFTHDYETKIMTFKTRLYATVGYRYNKWKLDDINMNLMGMSFQGSMTDFNMKTSATYVGIGYDFF